MRIRTKDEGRNHIRELVHGDEVVSGLTVIDYAIRIGGARVRMGGIAGVYTRRPHRRKGHMRTLMEDTVRYMTDEGYDVSMLFGIPDFYTKFGYGVCMAEHEFSLQTRDAELVGKASPPALTKRPLGKGELSAVLSIYNRNNAQWPCSIVRPRRYFQSFRKGSTYEVGADHFVLTDGRGRIAGYAVFDRSKTAVNVVEVEARNRATFPALMAALARLAVRRRCGEIKLLLPPGHAFADFALRCGCAHTARHPRNGGGMMRILNQEDLFKGVAAELQQRLEESGGEAALSSVEFRTELGSTILRLGGGLLRVGTRGRVAARIELPQHTLMQLIAGYREAADVMGDPDVCAPKRTLQLLERLFPRATPYVWQADRF